NSFRYAGRRHRDAIAQALQPVYTAPTEAAAKERFAEFAQSWGQRYPAIVRLREHAWAEFVPFLAFDTEIRRVICSTDEIVKSGWAGLGVCVAASGRRGPGRRVRRALPRWLPGAGAACRCMPRRAGG